MKEAEVLGRMAVMLDRLIDALVERASLSEEERQFIVRPLDPREPFPLEDQERSDGG